MFTLSWKRAAVAAVALSLGAATARAVGPVYLEQDSSPVFWGPAGDHAVLFLNYDFRATGTLTLRKLFTGDLSGQPMENDILTCAERLLQSRAGLRTSLTSGERPWIDQTSSGTGQSWKGLTTLTIQATTICSRSMRLWAGSSG